MFLSGQTAHRPKKYDRPEATANAAIAARLPFVMATSRFVHYLTVVARDKIGSFMEVSFVANHLNRWIKNYVNANDTTGREVRAKYPLRDAKVVVQPIADQPGSFAAIAWLRPWLEFEELTTSIRLEVRIPRWAGHPGT